MNNEEKVKYWIDIADYDLGTAETLFDGGRWALCRLYVPSGYREDIKGLLEGHAGYRTSPYTQSFSFGYRV